MPKTLAEIAIDAGFLTKAHASRAGKVAEERKLPLVVVLIRDFHVDELALMSAFAKQTRIPLADPAGVRPDADALRTLAHDVCARLRVIPLAVTREGAARVLRVAMADPTDSAAVAELEALTGCEIEVSALPLSAIDELIERGYRVPSSGEGARGGATAKAARAGRPMADVTLQDEVSVTAQIPIQALQPADVETRLTALVQLLVAKGVLTEAELSDVILKLKASIS